MKTARRVPVLVLALLLGFAAIAGARDYCEYEARPVEGPGLSNTYRVSFGLLRGAQPTAEGFLALEQLGVKTVVSLRFLHSDRDELAGRNLDYERIRFSPIHPETEEFIRFLAIAMDPARTPVFVHCKYGSDRTGAMVAVYRMAVCGRTREEAIQEMTSERFGFHPTWTNLVRFVEEMDVEAVKKEAWARINAGCCAAGASTRQIVPSPHAP